MQSESSVMNLGYSTQPSDVQCAVGKIVCVGWPRSAPGTGKTVNGWRRPVGRRARRALRVRSADPD
jgi:hypothetical protein